MSGVILINANSLHIPLADKSVQMCVTSPPYWGLRDYNVGGQLGLEETPQEFVANMVEVFREVKRVLRDDGVLWLNLGDSYAGSGGVGNQRNDANKGNMAKFKNPNSTAITKSGALKPKDLVGIPWRVAFALQEDGWYLRSDCIWAKPNPMPESVTDRPTKAHEYLFLLAKSEKYFYDADAIREENAGVMPWGDKRNFKMNNEQAQGRHGKGMFSGGSRDEYIEKYYTAGRNRRTVWTIATAPYSGAHFATYPPALVEPCIKAGSSEAGACSVCGAPWERVTNREFISEGPKRKNMTGQSFYDGWEGVERGSIRTTTTGFRPTCTHDAPTRPCIVLDPFAGSGTTLQVARNLGRHAVGLDLSYTYLHDQARTRLDLAALDAWTNGIQVEAPADLGPLFAGMS
jgi:DNA modification methylase